MDNYKCSVCGERKHFSDFYLSYAKTGWAASDGTKRRYNCRSCFSAASRKRRIDPSPGYQKSMMLSAAKKRANQRKVPFALTADDFSIPSHCPVLGLPLRASPYGTRHPTDNSPTLDRIVNEKGYVPGNVIVVSWLANRIKNTATPEMLRRVARFYEKLAEQGRDGRGVSEPTVSYLRRVAGQDRPVEGCF